MVISERAEEEDSDMHVDEIRIFSKLDDAKAFAKRKVEDILKIFNVPKDEVSVEETEKENSEEEYSIHANFQYRYNCWDVYVSVQKKEIE